MWTFQFDLNDMIEKAPKSVALLFNELSKSSEVSERESRDKISSLTLVTQSPLKLSMSWKVTTHHRGAEYYISYTNHIKKDGPDGTGRDGRGRTRPDRTGQDRNGPVAQN